MQMAAGYFGSQNKYFTASTTILTEPATRDPPMGVATDYDTVIRAYS
jgi:hypothetical protein